MRQTPGLSPILVRLLAALAGCVLAAPAWAQLTPQAPPRPPAPLTALPSPLAPAPRSLAWTRYPASELELRDMAALVHVVPEPRNDIAVALINTGPLPAPSMRVSQHRLIIDGGLRRRIANCRVDGAAFDVEVRGSGRIDSAHLPRLEIHVPQNAVVSAGGAVRLNMGRADSARVSLAGCGDADLEGASHNVDLAIAGGLNLRLYDANEVSVRVAGSGDVSLGVVRSGLSVSIAGSGDVMAAHADGPTNIAIQGAGDVTIRDGLASALSVVIAGSGDVRHQGEAAHLDAVILGSGDVHVRSVTGAVTRRIFGSGRVVVGS